MPYAHVERRPDGIAVIRLDTPHSPVNLVGRYLLQELTGSIASLQGDAAVLGIVLASAKPEGFIAGADVRELAGSPDEEGATAFARHGQEVLARVADGKPIVAAIHGAALGGGLEAALACHWRIATDDARTVLGFPEVQLGLLPAGGATQRLPRLVGLRAALPLLLTGKRIRAREALRIGLVDELAPPATLVEEACRAALALARVGGAKPPARRPLALRDRLSLLPPFRGLALREARRRAFRTTRGHYPAPRLILGCVEVGLRQGPDAGYRAEAEGFGRLAASAQARDLIWLFTASAALRHAPGAPPARPLRRVGVVGAGLMGEAIAAACLPLADVLLHDILDRALATALGRLRASLERHARAGTLVGPELETQLARLHATLDARALAGADLVIEAVPEDLELKRRVLARVEEAIPPDAVYASNTSSLPIAAIAEEAREPGRVLGMHYFSPVGRMRLLEIVVTPATTEAALLAARHLGVRQGKSVIVVRDGPGFFTTRVLTRYLDEAMRLLEEGASVKAVDRAARNFGFAVGPCALLDEVGLDVGAHVSRALARALPCAQPVDTVGRLYDVGFRGRKNGRGFYLYDRPARGRLRKVNPEVYRYLGGDRADLVPPPREELEDRLAYTFAIETVRCLQEQVVACPRDADVGAVLGLAFPPFRGGPLHWLDHVGPEHAAARIETLAIHYGERFRAPDLLLDLARAGHRFFDR